MRANDAFRSQPLVRSGSDFSDPHTTMTSFSSEVFWGSGESLMGPFPAFRQKHRLHFSAPRSFRRFREQAFRLLPILFVFGIVAHFSSGLDCFTFGVAFGGFSQNLREIAGVVHHAECVAKTFFQRDSVLGPVLVVGCFRFQRKGLQRLPMTRAGPPSQLRTTAMKLRFAAYSTKSSISVLTPGCSNFTPFL